MPIDSVDEWIRKDAIAVVPSTAKHILSVGCAAGKTEEVLINKGIEVVGVELNPKAAEIARERGLIVLEGDASEVDVDIAGDMYDCVLYADILEHLPDPLVVLKRHMKSLRPDGIVYITVPNFRHYSIFWQLFVMGRIRYRDAGILDSTHLKITTRKMILEWFEYAGIDLVNLKYFINRRRDKLASVCLCGLAKEFIATQIGLVGRKRRQVDKGQL
jgi:2-polyprenyl-3-methyl-5-hydroxy-6-metoxy-1,4-benzoquinol methylase